MGTRIWLLAPPSRPVPSPGTLPMGLLSFHPPPAPFHSPYPEKLHTAWAWPVQGRLTCCFLPHNSLGRSTHTNPAPFGLVQMYLTACLQQFWADGNNMFWPRVILDWALSIIATHNMDGKHYVHVKHITWDLYCQINVFTFADTYPKHMMLTYRKMEIDKWYLFQQKGIFIHPNYVNLHASLNWCWKSWLKYRLHFRKPFHLDYLTSRAAHSSISNGKLFHD